MGRESRVVKVRKFVFENKQDFRLVYEAFVSRGSAERDKKQSKDDHRSEARILKQLKAISEPEGSEPVNGSLDLRMRILREPGLSIELPQVDFKRLQEYVENCQWSAGIVDVIADLEDKLDTAEKINSEE